LISVNTFAALMRGSSSARTGSDLEPIRCSRLAALVDLPRHLVEVAADRWKLQHRLPEDKIPCLRQGRDAARVGADQ